MIKKLLLVLVIMSANTYAQSQNTVGIKSISNEAYDALTLFTINTSTYLINNCGEVVNQWSSAYIPGNAVYLLPNGNLLRAGRLEDGSSNITFGGRGGIVELFDWDDNLLWSYTYSSNEYRQHHDVYPLPNGNVLLLAATVMTAEEAIQAGRNPTLLVDNELYNEQIIELEPVGTNQANIVWEWNIKDHLIQEFDSTKDNFGVIADNPQKLDINFTNGNFGNNNWLHINSIQYNDARNQIVLSSRNLSEIWIIDHSTTTAEAASSSGGNYGKGGDLLYRWGNPQAYGQGDENDRTLFGQHYPHFIASGLPNENKILIFNNGVQRNPTYSQVDIISPPESSLGVYDYTANTAYAPLSTDFTYSDQSSDPSEFYSAIVSSAQQLPNGNILVCEGREGRFFELNSNQDIVWEYVNPVNNSTGEISVQGDPPSPQNLTFRAIKYALDFSAFVGRDLTPGLPIETNPDLSPCENLSISEVEDSIVSLYPNPTNDVITINSTLTIQKVEIYNILGTMVGKTSSNIVDLSSQSSGMYFLKIYSNSGLTSKKVIRN
jgi:Arylsulfotransferase (ASST)/Secretion system C-terminal sorting domain